jgi:hypothetical protein
VDVCARDSELGGDAVDVGRADCSGLCGVLEPAQNFLTAAPIASLELDGCLAANSHSLTLTDNRAAIYGCGAVRDSAS